MSLLKKSHRERLKVKFHKSKKSESKELKESCVSLEESIDKWEEVRDKGGWTDEALALHMLEIHKMHCDAQSCIATLHALSKPGMFLGLSLSSEAKGGRSLVKECNTKVKKSPERDPVATECEPTARSQSTICRDNGDSFEDTTAESSSWSNATKLSQSQRKSLRKRPAADYSEKEEVSDEEPSVRITYELMEEVSPEDEIKGSILSPSDGDGKVPPSGDSGLDSEHPKVKKPRNPPKWAISWREMVITFNCKVCDFITTSPVFACQHLLLAHPDIVEPLHEYLNKEVIPGSEESLYNFVHETAKLKENSPFCTDIPLPGKKSTEGDELETYVVPVQHDTFEDMEQFYSSDDKGDKACDKGVSRVLRNDTCKQTSEDNASGSIPDSDCVLPNDSDANVAVKTDGASKITEGASQISEEEDKLEPLDKFPLKGREVGKEKKVKFTELSLIEIEELIAYMRRWMYVDKHCNKCHSKIKGQRLTNLHHCAANTGVTLCEICGKYYRNNGYGNHVRQVHKKGKIKEKCKLCSKEMTPSALFKHFRYVHERELHRVECGICGKTMSTKEHLRRHEVIHRLEMPFKCPFCQRGFSQKSNMHHHIRQHTGEQPYNCDHCPKAFTHKVSLKNHLKKQHGIDLWKQGHTGGGRPKAKDEANYVTKDET